MKQVEKLIDEAIDREGGYINHPADRGGPTRWGITEQVARAFGYGGDMRALPRETAEAIYYRRYWTQPGFAGVAVRFPAVAVELFDIGVNMGSGVAATFLQRVLNVLNSGGKHYPDIAVDGALGQLTFAACDALFKRRGAEAEDRLLEGVRSLRGARYIAISESRPANEAFTYGWFGRMVEMAKAKLQ